MEKMEKPYLEIDENNIDIFIGLTKSLQLLHFYVMKKTKNTVFLPLVQNYTIR